MLKKYVGRALAVCLAVVFAACLCVGVSAHSFRDVKEYDEAIDLLSSIEVIKGYSNTSFGPEDKVTRWQMALLMSKLVTGSTETTRWSNSAGTAFTDIVAAAHYPAAINYAHNNGIIIGRTATEFYPDDNITVQEGITMCVRALGYPRSSYDSGYPNSYISKGKELGLFEGLYNLSYTAYLTRGQTAQMLYNALFAPTYSGATLADDAFGFVDCNIVLAATENVKYDSTEYADRGTYIFREINDYGRLGDSYELDADLFDFDDPDAAIGIMYSVRATDNFEKILSLDLVSKTLSSKNTGSLTVNTSKSTISMGGYEYTPKSLRSYTLENGKSPSSREIIIYALHDDVTGGQYKSGNVLTTAKIAGTTGYYSITAYDDNNDGYADRAFYKSYAFGQYKEESGKIAIAGGNKKNDIEITGKTNVKDGDYVLYCFDSQTLTLDIYKILSQSEGTVSSYDSSNSKIVINNVTYSLGTDNVRGAKPSDVAKTFGTSTSVNGRKIKFYADPDTKWIFAAELQGEELSLSGNYYGSNTGIVTYYDVYNPYGSVWGSTTSNNTEYIYIQINNNNQQNILIRSVDGTAVSRSNLLSLLGVGDIVTLTQAGSVSVPASNSYTQSMPIYDVTVVSNKSSFVSTSTNTLLYVEKGYFYAVDGTSGRSIVQPFPVTENTKVFIYTGQSNSVAAYSEITKTDGGWYRDTSAENPTGGFPLGNNYYAFFIGQTSTFFGTGTVDAIYIRPFDYSAYASTSTSYNNIVYIGNVNSYQTSTAMGSSEYYYVYNYVTDLSTCAPTYARVSSSKGRLTTPGFYKVLNGYITDTTPVTTSIQSDAVSLLINPTVSSVYANSDKSRYSFTIGTMNYTVDKANIQILMMNNSNQFGGGTTLTPIQKYETDTTNYTTDFDFYLRMLEMNAGSIKAVFTQNTSQQTFFYNGVLHLILGN